MHWLLPEIWKCSLNFFFSQTTFVKLSSEFCNLLKNRNISPSEQIWTGWGWKSQVSMSHFSYQVRPHPSLVDRQTNMTKTLPLSILCMQAVKIPEYLRVLPQIRHKHWNFHRWQSRIVPLRSSSSIRGGKGGVCLHQEKRRCPLYSVGSRRTNRWRIAYRMHCYCGIGGTRKVQLYIIEHRSNSKRR